MFHAILCPIYCKQPHGWVAELLVNQCCHAVEQDILVEFRGTDAVHLGNDLGSGRGTDALRLAEEVGEKGFVYGIDISEGMIKKAIATAAKLGTENVKFLRTELENLPIEDKSVDLVISNCTINHASDKLRVWQEIARILRKGGRFVVSDIYSSKPVPEEFKNDPEAIAECWAGAVTREEYMSHLQKAGFTNIEILEESAPYAKGKIKVSSFTIFGKTSKCLSCS